MIDISLIPFYLNTAEKHSSHSKKCNRAKYLETCLLKLVGVSKKIYVGVQNESDINVVKDIANNLDFKNIAIVNVECHPMDLPSKLCIDFKKLNFEEDQIIFFIEADQFLTNTITLARICDLLKRQENIIYSPHRIEKLYKKEYGKWLTKYRVPDFDKEERLPFMFFGEYCYHPNTYKRFLTNDNSFYKSPDWVDAYSAAFLTNYKTFKKIPFEKYANTKCLEGPSFSLLSEGLDVLKTTDNTFSVIHMGGYEYNARVINEELSVEKIIEDHRKLLYNQAS